MTERSIEATVAIALRRFVREEDPARVQTALVELVEQLGGRVTSEEPHDGAAIRLDVSSGPVAWALPPEEGPAGDQFSDVVRALTEDARRLVTWRRQLDVLEAGPIDPDTGCLRETAVARIAARLWPGDAILFVGLDGEEPGRDLVRRFAGLVLSEMRLTDHVGRVGSHIAVLARNTSLAGAEAAITRLRRRWAASDPSTTFSAGVAMVGSSGTEALQAAQETLERVRRDRTDAWDVAPDTGEEWQPSVSDAPTSQDRRWSSGPQPGGH